MAVKRPAHRHLLASFLASLTASLAASLAASLLGRKPVGRGHGHGRGSVGNRSGTGREPVGRGHGTGREPVGRGNGHGHYGRLRRVRGPSNGGGWWWLVVALGTSTRGLGAGGRLRLARPQRTQAQGPWGWFRLRVAGGPAPERRNNETTTRKPQHPRNVRMTKAGPPATETKPPPGALGRVRAD